MSGDGRVSSASGQAEPDDRTSELSPGDLESAATVADLAALLHSLRRRYARRRGEPVLSYRRLAARSGWSHSSIGQYFGGQVLPPPDRFDELARLLGASSTERRRLADAYDRIADRLRAPTAVDTAAPAGTDRNPVRPVPAQLPMDVADFVGRAAELAELDRLCARLSPTESPGPESAGTGAAGTGSSTTGLPVVVAVVGTAGVGKTSLAVHFAHRVRTWFPDGQLYVDLRGHHPERPMDAAEALAGFLRAFQVPAGEPATGEAELAARYRTEIAGRRVLVVLDNAASADQVRPLLPGTGTCLVLVTSRDAQPGLVARNGIRRLHLDVLPREDGLTLLRRLLGEQVERDVAAATRLLEECARLPLAVRIAAELAAARPATSLAGLVEELGDEQRRLAGLAVGDDRYTGVEAVFSWSYRECPTVARAVFRRLGLHPGRDYDAHSVAALTGLGADEAAHVLRTLAQAHMVQRREPAASGDVIRYGTHDLLRAYAAGLAAAEETEPERDAALDRLYEHYVQAAGRAAATLYPSDSDRWPAGPPPDTAVPRLDEPGVALRWLDVELPNLVAAVEDAAAHHRDGHVVRLAMTLFRYLDGGHLRDALAVHRAAVEAARRLHDRAAEARALGDLGVAHWQNNDWTGAADHFQRALDRCVQLPDPAGAARNLNNLGVTYWRQGDLELAVEYCTRAREEFRDQADRQGEARAVMNLGVVRNAQGRLESAAGLLSRAVAVHHAIRCHDGEAYALTNLGSVLARCGRLDQAVEHHRRALDLFRALGDDIGEVLTLNHLGIVEREHGRFAEAAALHQEALLRSRRDGDLRGQAFALTSLGVVAHRGDRHDEAADLHRQALELSRRVGDRRRESEALNGLADALRDANRHHEANVHYRDALALALATGDVHEQGRARDGLVDTAAGHTAAGQAAAGHTAARSRQAGSSSLAQKSKNPS
jgi:tetratricopeptide (TPR) repeat protein